MSTKTNLYSLLLAAALLGAGCSGEDTPLTPADAEGDGKVEIALCAGMTLKAQVEATRSYTGKAAFAAGTDEIGVLAFADADHSQPLDYNTNCKYTATAEATTVGGNSYTQFSSSRPVFFMPGTKVGEQMYLYAYYPYRDNLSDTGTSSYTLPVASSMLTDTDTYKDYIPDPLYSGVATATKEKVEAGVSRTQQVSLTFRHAMAWMEINFKLAAAASVVSCTLQQLTFTFADGQTGTMNVLTGVLTPASTGPKVCQLTSLNASLDATTGCTLSETVFPGKLSGITANLSVQVNAALPVVYANITIYAGTPDITFKSGTKTTINVTLNQDVLTAPASRIESWTDEEISLTPQASKRR